MKFSIGIPAYKAKFLSECIESVLSQSYQDFELIILNDASPENVDAIVEMYQDERIRYYKNEYNVGAELVVQNWNKCLELSTGDYFVCIGDDDLLDPSYLLSFRELIEENPETNVFHCRTLIINEDSISYGVTSLCPEWESASNFILSCLKGERQQYLGDFVYKRDFLIRNKGYNQLPLGWCSDYLTAFAVSGKNGLVYTNKALFKYRVNRINITSTGSVELKRKAVLGLTLWVESYVANYESEDKIEKFEIESLKQYLEIFHMRERLNFVRQYLGGGIVNIFNLVRDRSIYDIRIQDIIRAVLYALSLKV